MWSSVRNFPWTSSRLTNGYTVNASDASISRSCQWWLVQQEGVSNSLVFLFTWLLTSSIWGSPSGKCSFTEFIMEWVYHVQKWQYIPLFTIFQLTFFSRKKSITHDMNIRAWVKYKSNFRICLKKNNTFDNEYTLIKSFMCRQWTIDNYMKQRARRVVFQREEDISWLSRVRDQQWKHIYK